VSSIAILGAGRSGRAAERLARAAGDEPTVLDGNDTFPEGVTFARAVVSPGIAPTHRWLDACRAHGIPVASELQYGCEALKRRGVRLLAVTGSKGKSSVVKLVAEALGGVACGNFGLPVSEVALDERAPEWAVVEVSSFMMETTELAHDTFDAAVILNLQEDHLDRHGSLATYHGLKRKLLRFARQPFEPDAFASPCSDDALLAGSYFDNTILRPNGRAAVALLRAAGLAETAVADAFAHYKPLPHRMNLVGTFGGVRCVDDSKATSLAALVAAIEMTDGPVRLIAGGLQKGDDPKVACTPLTRRAKKVYLIGQSAEKFFSAWHAAAECELCGTLERAVECSMREAENGETILLSPGTASFDQFKSYEERGEVFARLVKKEGQKK